MRAREDTADQEAAALTARQELGDALDTLITEAKLAKSGARRWTRGSVDLDPVYAAINALRQAEEAHDLSLLDLATAGGADA